MLIISNFNDLFFPHQGNHLWGSYEELLMVRTFTQQKFYKNDHSMFNGIICVFKWNVQYTRG